MFESLWLTQWKSRLATVKSALLATLLIRHPVTNVLVVNIDPGLLATFIEAKVID